MRAPCVPCHNVASVSPRPSRREWRSRAAMSDRVLLTREASKNDKLRELLDGLAIATYELPLVEHSRDAAGMDEVASKIGDDGTWVVITSPEAARVFLVSTAQSIEARR